MSLNFDDVKNAFLAEAEKTLAEFKDLEEKARPILLKVAELSSKVAYYRLINDPLPALETSLIATLRELELAGLLAIRNAWEKNITNIFQTITKVLIGLAATA